MMPSSSAVGAGNATPRSAIASQKKRPFDHDYDSADTRQQSPDAADRCIRTALMMSALPEEMLIPNDQRRQQSSSSPPPPPSSISAVPSLPTIPRPGVGVEGRQHPDDDDGRFVVLGGLKTAVSGGRNDCDDEQPLTTKGPTIAGKEPPLQPQQQQQRPANSANNTLETLLRLGSLTGGVKCESLSLKRLVFNPVGGGSATEPSKRQRRGGKSGHEDFSAFLAKLPRAKVEMRGEPDAATYSGPPRMMPNSCVPHPLGGDKFSPGGEGSPAMASRPSSSWTSGPPDGTRASSGETRKAERQFDGETSEQVEEAAIDDDDDDKQIPTEYGKWW